MTNFRFLLALIFMTELMVAICHFVLGFILGNECPLYMYLLMPAIVVSMFLLVLIIQPILDWIAGV